MIKVNGREFPWEEGLTVKKLLQKKNYTFPSIVVKINDRTIAEDEYADALIEDGDDVKVIHLITGG
ncbi:sulfur carrier protein [Desulfohalotomaculum tongense]|uniref:sulfur carrier protein ThiS n=1 Tax=Desulforadius tongensis TaxID=1216062 RepID=UPI001959B5D3|nr:sulfur carrier protein ThiS [Desulforadius tongensis]MBM7854745.1 sulfur carrier protein [Desulforadius tongensis]